jgi:ligand-binding sensor domain-containing protein/signal transduction histidine kinase
MTRLGMACVTATALLFGSAPAQAQRLPFATYTTAQGLAGNNVSAAVEDADGFLWIATDHGLSRFDGQGFRTFGRERGLTDERITALLIASDAALWIGTPSGVYRFAFRDGGMFTLIPVEGQRLSWEYTTLAIDRDQRLWCGADGLYRLERAADGHEVLRRVPVPRHVSLPFVNALAVDRMGNIWAAAYEHLYCRRPDGEFQPVLEDQGSPTPAVMALATDPRGRVWVAARDGLLAAEEREPMDRRDPCRIRRVVDRDVAGTPVWNPTGGFWVGTPDGLVEFDAQDRPLRRISREQGLVGGTAAPILLDRQGDLWIATQLTALQRLSGNGLTAFGRVEGLEATRVRSIFTTHAGELVVVGVPHVIQRLEKERFVVIRPLMPTGVREAAWGWHQIDAQDRFGQWWIATQQGIAHWPAVRHPDELARTRAIGRLAWRGCFRGQEIFRVYEDSHSDLWIGTIESGKPTLHRWRRATDTIECFSTASFLDREAAPTAFLDDGRGTLWIGFYNGQLARYRDGRFVCVLDCTDPTQGNINGMALDRRGRLWIATGLRGVLRIEDTAVDHPSVVRVTASDGLASNRTRAVLEDRFGRIYIGTDLGIDLLDAHDRPQRHYSTDDGLPNPFISMASKDRNGDLWFGTLDGVARLHPAPPTVAPVPRVVIDAIRITGVARAIAAVGVRQVTDIVLAPDQRNLEVDFVALPRSESARLRFQHRLSETESWSPPSPTRSVVLANLAAGDHRLEIRPVETAGQEAPVAIVAFRVLAPIHQRGWFLTLAGLVLTTLLSLGYRSRLAYATALERQRTRIAMDLHDEMGSRLGSIGLLADLAAKEAASPSSRQMRLERIAEAAAEMGSSLGDIVWSLRQGVTTLEAVASRIGIHGRQLFPGTSPVFVTRFPEPWPAVDVSPAVGRAVMLIALEALHTCARHARAQLVTLDLHPTARNWVLSVFDDGVGIQSGSEGPSGSRFGFHTMQQRARDIGGSLHIESSPGRGTTVRLTFQLQARHRSDRMNIREIWSRPRDHS